MGTFRTQYDEPTKFYAPTGTKTELRHEPVMRKNGRRVLERTRLVALYDLIQANREQCEIDNIIRRAVEGDYNALNAVNGIYTDITNCPSSIAEAQQFIIEAKKEFDKLPKEIKSKFEFNPEIYIAEMSADTQTWLDKMGYSEAIKIREESEKAEQLSKDNFNKAMANLAQGTSVTNAGGGDNE